MKIYITGPSGSGKTTLAKKIAATHNIPHAELDYIMIRRFPRKKGHRVPESEWRKSLEHYSTQENWIIEGCNIIPEVMNCAEKILYIKASWYLSLFRQWKRYFIDKKQREDYGLRSNLRHSMKILIQYFGSVNPNKLKDPFYVRVKCCDLALAPHQHKTMYVMNKRDYKHAEELFTRQA